MELDLTVNVTTDDYRAYIRFVQEQAKKTMSKGENAVRTKFLSLLFWVFVGLTLTFLANWSGNPIHLPSAIGSAVIITVICLTKVWWHSKRLQDHMMPEQDGIILGEHHYHFRNQSIDVKSRYGNSVLQWECVKSIEETPTHLFLLLDRYCGYILPKRAFDGEVVIANFKAQVLGKIRSH